MDSYFWGFWLWPELQVFWLNTVENKSSEWGVSPWHWYFLKAIPKSVTIAYPLAFFAIIYKPSTRYIDWKVIELLIPAVMFVGLYSLLPHKELRFIFPALTVFNLVGAIGLSRISKYFPLGKMIVGVLLISSLIFSSGMTYISYLNYPGGNAMREFNRDFLSVQNSSTSQILKMGPNIHIDVSI